MTAANNDHQPTGQQTGASKQLYRSRTDKKLLGICGGVAEYFNADPTLVRLTAVVLVLITGGAGVIAYLVGGIVIPEKPESTPAAQPPAIDKK